MLSADELAADNRVERGRSDIREQPEHPALGRGGQPEANFGHQPQGLQRKSVHRSGRCSVPLCARLFAGQENRFAREFPREMQTATRVRVLQHGGGQEGPAAECRPRNERYVMSTFFSICYINHVQI